MSQIVISKSEICLVMDELMYIRKVIRSQIQDPIWRQALLKKSNNALNILSNLEIQP